MKKIVVIGAGGHSKVVLDILEKMEYEIVGLTDPSVARDTLCLGYPILGDDSKLDELFEQGVIYAAIGIGHVGFPKIRNKVFASAKEKGFYFPQLVHISAVVARTANIGDGTIIASQSVINPDAQIGCACILNTACVVEHEVVIADGVHIAPHATVLGNASIDENSFVGAGSVVLQGVHVGKNCIIGAGSVVLHDVPDNVVVVGCPARVVKRREA